MTKTVFAIQSASGRFHRHGFHTGYSDSLWEAATFESLASAKGYLTKLKKKADYYIKHYPNDKWYTHFKLVPDSKIVVVELDYKVLEMVL